MAESLSFNQTNSIKMMNIAPHIFNEFVCPVNEVNVHGVYLLP